MFFTLLVQKTKYFKGDVRKKYNCLQCRLKNVSYSIGYDCPLENYLVTKKWAYNCIRPLEGVIVNFISNKIIRKDDI